MALITGQSIPPSLSDLYSRTLVTSNDHDSAADVVRLAKNVFSSDPWITDDLTLARAHVAADWIVQRHAAGMSGAAKTDFRSSRVAELVAGVFDPEFWAQAVQNGVIAQKFVPFGYPEFETPHPDYTDPLRQQWRTVYDVVPTSYAVPAPQTGGATPSPGFYGDVQALYFRDQWMCQYRYDFTLAHNSGSEDGRPLWALADIQLDASSSFSGNRMWLSANVGALRVNNGGGTTNQRNDNRERIAQQNIYRFGLNPPATPWSQSVTKKAVFDVWHGYKQAEILPSFRQYLFVSPSPPRGRYFSLNDWVRVWLASTASMYTAKDAP